MVLRTRKVSGAFEKRAPEPFVSHAKAASAKRNEKGYGNENDRILD